MRRMKIEDKIFTLSVFFNLFYFTLSVYEQDGQDGGKCRGFNHQKYD